MKIEKIRVEDLSLDPANARKHPERNLEAIKASLRRFGQQKPIVIDASNVVRAGNGTLEAAKALGWETLDCVRTELTGSEATAYAIADNRTAELAEWDNECLAAHLVGLQTEDEELAACSGFDVDEIEKMMSDGKHEKQMFVAPMTYRVIVEVKNEVEQSNLMQRLESEGYKCLPLMS